MHTYDVYHLEMWIIEAKTIIISNVGHSSTQVGCYAPGGNSEWNLYRKTWMNGRFLWRAYNEKVYLKKRDTCGTINNDEGVPKRCSLMRCWLLEVGRGLKHASKEVPPLKNAKKQIIMSSGPLKLKLYNKCSLFSSHFDTFSNTNHIFSLFQVNNLIAV